MLAQPVQMPETRSQIEALERSAKAGDSLVLLAL